MKVAEGVGLRKSRPANDLDCLTWPIGPIEAKGNFRGLSNRDGPLAQIETAAEAGPLNGGKTAHKNAHHCITKPGRRDKLERPGCELILIAERVARLLPSHRDPEAFHIEKSEIVGELRRLAREGGL